LYEDGKANDAFIVEMENNIIRKLLNSSWRSILSRINALLDKIKILIEMKELKEPKEY
jgi:hypothetical protein